ncbi:MAG: DMT family transporter [Atribacterota bacterium]|nr:DMT family transporter [Atribacterota bacterium]
MKKNSLYNSNENIKKDIYSKNIKAILILIFSSFLTALIGLLVKKVNNLPVMELVFFRNLGMMIFAPILLIKNKIPIFGSNKKFLILRGLTGFISISSMYFAYTNMLLANAITIKQLFPIFVIILSFFFLKERLLKIQIPLILLAFLGVVLIIKPAMQSNLLPSFIALNGAFFFAITQVILRHLRSTDHSLVIIGYLAYISGLLGLSTTLIQKTFVFPDLKNFIILLIIAILCLISSYGFARAYGMAHAGFLSFYMYSEIIFATILGIFFLQEFPDLYSIMGTLLIMISGIANFRIKTKYEEQYHLE